jgi:hypothetical protein
LTNTIVVEMRRAFRSEASTISGLAADAGVHVDTAKAAIRGLTWARVGEPPVPLGELVNVRRRSR